MFGMFGRKPKVPRPDGVRSGPPRPFDSLRCPSMSFESWSVVMESRETRPSAAQRRDEEAERRRRRTLFLRELAEARELRARIQPRRVRNERLRQMMRMRTFRY